MGLTIQSALWAATLSICSALRAPINSGANRPMMKVQKVRISRAVSSSRLRGKQSLRLPSRVDDFEVLKERRRRGVEVGRHVLR